jgi:hypothetical protein
MEDIAEDVPLAFSMKESDPRSLATSLTPVEPEPRGVAYHKLYVVGLE